MTAHRLAIPPRRGACPGLSAPMPTGDGLLVRLLPADTIPLAAFVVMGTAAQTHGNGIVEVTSRGSLQFRGLSPLSAAPFAAAIAALDIAAGDGVAVHCNPLFGIDAEEIFDAGALAADLRRRLTRQSMTAKISAKISVTVDGSGALNLANLAADIRLCAQASNGGVRLRIGVGGDDQNAAQLGVVAPADGAEAVVRLLDVVAARGHNARARDVLTDGGADAFRSAMADLFVSDAPAPAARPSHEAIGLHRLRDGSLACGIGLGFGHADAIALQQMVEAAAVYGASGLRVAPDRMLMIIGLTRNPAAFTDIAARLGFIVRPGDPRRRVVACAGAPICGSAHIATRAIAPLVAEGMASRRNDTATIHISGCAKGCARATAAVLTVVGTPEGCALIANGSPRDTPFAMVTAEELPAAIMKHARAHKHEAADV